MCEPILNLWAMRGTLVDAQSTIRVRVSDYTLLLRSCNVSIVATV
jgi:hypothetical protein